MKNNAIGWVEVPVEDMERAIRFYETVFDFKIERHQLGPLDMGWFPWVEEGYGSGGSLVKHEQYKPMDDGVLAYFTAHSGNLDNELARVEEAGGVILQSKTKISDEHGFMATILDCEGNRIALHSRQ
jgi:predicted enzyme related to lactoylglutathione lyase